MNTEPLQAHAAEAITVACDRLMDGDERGELYAFADQYMPHLFLVIERAVVDAHVLLPEPERSHIPPWMWGDVAFYVAMRAVGDYLAGLPRDVDIEEIQALQTLIQNAVDAATANGEES